MQKWKKAKNTKNIRIQKKEKKKNKKEKRQKGKKGKKMVEKWKTCVKGKRQKYRNTKRRKIRI